MWGRVWHGCQAEIMLMATAVPSGRSSAWAGEGLAAAMRSVDVILSETQMSGKWSRGRTRRKA